MGLIYSNSDLNLSASGFTDARSGMLGPPHRLIVPPTFPLLDGERVLLVHAHEYFDQNLPLDRRGWVIQENMLVSSITSL